MRSTWFLLLGLLPATAVAQTSADEAALFEQLTMREQILDAQRVASAGITRERSLLAYRLCRQRELGFAPSPESRLEDARAFDLALLALRRSAEETRSLARALDRVRIERTAVEAAFVDRVTSQTAASAAAGITVPLTRPVRGVVVARPGSRKDSSTKVELRHDGVEFLARLNEPVRAVAPGTVRRVEALPQGGFAVVTGHAGGLVSIVTGLRDIAVAVGDKVGAGQTLGLVGRNLDGAAVVTMEIWRDRRPQDAARLLRMQARTGGS
jgi:septal ring factor EnvC (AmiA/AmiB activator)